MSDQSIPGMQDVGHVVLMDGGVVDVKASTEAGVALFARDGDLRVAVLLDVAAASELLPVLAAAVDVASGRDPRIGPAGGGG